MLHFLTFTQHHGVFCPHLLISFCFLFDDAVCSVLNETKAAANNKRVTHKPVITLVSLTCKDGQISQSYDCSVGVRVFREQLLSLYLLMWPTSTHPAFWPVHHSLTRFTQRTEVGPNMSQHKNNHKTGGGGESALLRKTYAGINPYLSLDSSVLKTCRDRLKK